MVGEIGKGAKALESVVVEEKKDVAVDDASMKRASGDFSGVAPENADLNVREAGAAVVGKADQLLKMVNDGVEKLDKGAKYLEKNEVGKAGKEAKGAMKELKSVISDINQAEGKAKLGFVKSLAVALLKVATSLSKLCEFLAGLTIEVMGEEDTSTVTQIAKLVQSLTKPINEFVKNYEAKAKEKAEAALKEVEEIAAEIDGTVEDLVTA